MTNNRKSLAIHYHIEASLVNDEIYYPHYFGRWVDSLSPHFEKIYLITHIIRDHTNLNNYCVKAKNLQVINLGRKIGTFRRIYKFRSFQKIVNKYVDNIDVVIFRVPSPLAVYLSGLFNKKIKVYFLVGNMINAIKATNLPLHKKLPTLLYWYFDHYLLAKYSKKALVLANGPTFLEEFKRIKNQNVIFTSTIWENEIAENRQSTINLNNVRLIYLGRISKEKGLDTLFNALVLLEKSKLKCSLTIVGEGDSNYVTELKKICYQLGLDNVKFIGHLSEIQEIFSILSIHDIFVLPSNWDWQPRSIWEAMSAGLPIICSDGVQSPRLLFESTGEIRFFKAMDSSSLADSIIDVATDVNYREGLVNASINISKQRTLEKSAEYQIKLINEFR